MRAFEYTPKWHNAKSLGSQGMCSVPECQNLPVYTIEVDTLKTKRYLAMCAEHWGNRCPYGACNLETEEPYDTDWYGTLQYGVCKNCNAIFVRINNGMWEEGEQ